MVFVYLLILQHILLHVSRHAGEELRTHGGRCRWGAGGRGGALLLRQLVHRLFQHTRRQLRQDVIPSLGRVVVVMVVEVEVEVVVEVEVEVVVEVEVELQAHLGAGRVLVDGAWRPRHGRTLLGILQVLLVVEVVV